MVIFRFPLLMVIALLRVILFFSLIVVIEASCKAAFNSSSLDTSSIFSASCTILPSVTVRLATEVSPSLFPVAGKMVAIPFSSK